MKSHMLFLKLHTFVFESYRVLELKHDYFLLNMAPNYQLGAFIFHI